MDVPVGAYWSDFDLVCQIRPDAIEALLVGVSSEALLQIAATRADDVSV